MTVGMFDGHEFLCFAFTCLRYSVGVLPVYFLKNVQNCDLSVKPTSLDTAAMESSVLVSSLLATRIFSRMTA